jgi:cysteine synthase A
LGSVILNDRVENPVVTVFPDDNKKYLSTDLAQNVDKQDNYISNHIQLIGWEAI